MRRGSERCLMTIHRFGEKKQGIHYTVRIGAHCIVFNKSRDKILLVSPPNGSYLLPGGEIEHQETHIEALKRESMEELGFEVEAGEYLGEAEDYYYSAHRKNHYHNPAHFYIVSSWEKVGEPLEDFNTLNWVTIPEALQLLKRGSHRWAIEQLL